MTRSRWIPLSLLALVATLTWGLQIQWVALDQGPPDSDEWHHLVKAYGYWVGWHGSGLRGLAHAMRLTQTTFPPLVHLGALPWFEWAGGFSTDLAVWSLGPWLLVLCVACYGLGRHLAGPWAGLVSAAMAVSAPLMICLSRKFLLDLPLAAMVATSLWALLASRGLSRPVLAWLSGVAFGLALLAKFIAGVYLLGAFACIMLPAGVACARRWPRRSAAVVGTAALLVLLALGLEHQQATLWWREFPEQAPPFLSWVTVEAVPLRLSWIWHATGLASIGLAWAAHRQEHQGLRALLGGAAALLVASWLAGCWYLPHLPRVIKGVAGFAAEGGLGEGDPTAGTAAGWSYYLWVLGHSLPRAWYHLAALGLGASLLHPELRRRAGPLVGGVLLAWLLISLSTNKESRYTLSLLPSVAALATGVTLLLPRWAKGAVLAVLGLGALALSGGWVAVERGRWDPPPQQRWYDDRIASSAIETPMDRSFPGRLELGALLLPPPFPIVTPLPREMPFSDRELPYDNFGP
jgi:4-amino-4-deoxy-L-arabinose transferase-like glycosyltransferase